VNDRMWFREFKRATQRVDTNSVAFLRKAQLGFQKFMYLLAKWPMKMENINFSPCPPIDLMWHTYLVQPTEYAIFCKKLIINVVHHKLLPRAKRTLMTYSSRHDKEEKLWMEEFDESTSIYVSAPTQQEQKREKEMHYMCDVCDARLDQERYHCTECEDFDLCKSCAEKGMEVRSHSKNHSMTYYTPWGAVTDSIKMSTEWRTSGSDSSLAVFQEPHGIYLIKQVTNAASDECCQMQHLSFVELPYFEVEIKELEQGGVVAIGGAMSDAALEKALPGWNENTFGYHGDDGNLFVNDGTKGKKMGPTFGKGDVVGCGIRKKLAVTMVYWTKNGKKISSKKLGFNMNPSKLFAMIGVDKRCELRVNTGSLPFRLMLDK